MTRGWPALLLAVVAGCSDDPPTPQPGTTPAASPRPSPTATRILAAGDLPAPELDAATPIEGGWTFKASATGAAALFGPPAQEARIAVRCNPQARRIAFVVRAAGAQDAALRIVTDAAAARYSATVTDEGIEADVPVDDAFLTALARRQERLALVLDGTAVALPWDRSVADVIFTCRRPR